MAEVLKNTPAAPGNEEAGKGAAAAGAASGAAASAAVESAGGATPAAEAGDGAGSDSSGAAPADQQSAAGATGAAQQAQDRRDRRIAKLVAEKKALKEALEKGPAPAPGAQPDANQVFNDAVKAAVTKQLELDRKAAEVKAFNKACDEAAAKGHELYGQAEFDGRVRGIFSLVDSSDPDEVAAYWGLIGVAIETGNPTRVLYELGGNLEEADRIMNLPVARQAIALAKMAESNEAPGESRVPKPIKPLGGRENHNVQIDPSDPGRADHLSTAEWMARRNAQDAERFKRTGRR